MLGGPATKPRKQALQNRSRATVAALIEATARVLVKEGYEKASTNRIAEVAGVSIGSLYQYFPTKEALVFAVVQQHNRDILALVGDALAKVDALPVEEVVRSLVRVAIDAHRMDPKLHKILTEQIPRTPAMDEAGALAKAHDVLRSYLHARRDELGVNDVNLAAFICATSIEALAHNAVLHHAEFAEDEIRRLTEETVRLITGFLIGGDQAEQSTKMYQRRA
jgi:AcrR family transcriptional regulator